MEPNTNTVSSSNPNAAVKKPMPSPKPRRRFWKRPRFLTGLVIVLLIIAGLSFWPNHGWLVHKNPPGVTQKASEVDISISLKGGKPEHGPFVYGIKKGSKLVFTINSDQLGSIYVPTSPQPQNINFSQSPVIFSVTASNTGQFKLYFQAKDAKAAVLIATLDIKQ